MAAPGDYGQLTKVIVESQFVSPRVEDGVEPLSATELAEPAPEGTFDDEGHEGGPADLIHECDSLLAINDNTEAGVKPDGSGPVTFRRVQSGGSGLRRAG